MQLCRLIAKIAINQGPNGGIYRELKNSGVITVVTALYNGFRLSDILFISKISSNKCNHSNYNNILYILF